MWIMKVLNRAQLEAKIVEILDAKLDCEQHQLEDVARTIADLVDDQVEAEHDRTFESLTGDF